MSVQAARPQANGGARMNRDLRFRGERRDNARASEFLNDRLRESHDEQAA
jgi:hypothetical protein